jgi:hypothetical protein
MDSSVKIFNDIRCIDNLSNFLRVIKRCHQNLFDPPAPFMGVCTHGLQPWGFSPRIEDEAYQIYRNYSPTTAFPLFFLQ